MNYQVSVFTKEVSEDRYPAGLAGAVHFALDGESGERIELNRGYGLLFARAEISPEGTIIPKAVRNPGIFRTSEGEFLICAVRTEENGDPEPAQRMLYWESEDLIHFTETEAETAEKTAAEEGLLPAVLTEEEAKKVLDFWNTEPGKALVPFPKARGFADPVFWRHEEKWYFIFTNDNENDIGLYMREADRMEDLLSDETPLYKILDVDEEAGLIQNFWAPEIHEIGGEIYIFFAVSGREFGPCCHVMKLRKGGNPADPLAWEKPIPVRRKDGSVLTKPEYLLTEAEKRENRPVTEDFLDDRFGISLDMTYFEDAGKSYLIWSYRKDIGTPRDSGSMLLIAETTKERPWLLRTDPVLLSRPLYGYENCRGTINNEGPYVYKKNGRIHVNYSGGDARGYLYIINLLSADSGADLLDPKSFRKRTTPLCNFKTWTSVYGPGHNSYFTDDQGKDWILFHAVDTMAGKRIAVGAFAYPENLE